MNSHCTGQSSAVICRGIRADDFRQRVAARAQQRRRQVALDVLDQAKALVDQRGIKLDQAGAGADLCQRGAAGVDAADADQGEWRLPHAHRFPPPSVSTGGTAGGQKDRPAPSYGWSRAGRGRASVVLDDHAVDAARAREWTTSSGSLGLRSGAVFSSTRKSPAFLRTRSRASIPFSRRWSIAAIAAVAQARRVW